VSVRRASHVAAIGLVACAIGLVSACGGDDDAVGDRSLSGGAGTVRDTTPNAFALALRTLPSADRRAFQVGNSFFNRNWVRAPASASGRDGLGPTFNAQSCSSCHLHDGRGRPPAGPGDPERGLLLRLSVAGPDGSPQPVRLYGGQLQDRAIGGVPVEGRIRITRRPMRGRYADGTRYTLLAPRYKIVDRAFGPLPAGAQISPRVAPGVFGVGLLEAVPEAAILAHADPRDADRDGISGRPNRVPEERSPTTAVTDGDAASRRPARVPDAHDQATALGRFGWKANVPTVEQQNAAAFNGDIGITSPVFRDPNCPPGQNACRAARDGGTPEIDARKLDRVTFYTRTLAVPARRDVGRPVTAAGERRFADVGCTACHLPMLRTGASDVAGLRDQVIRPYTDLLLHDMGPGLADGRPDGLATGSEWRTAPLWGIGLVRTVNHHTRFLHDGRARDVTEAILWHGGEGRAAREAFEKLPARARRELVAFLNSL
jgi:CxxC motif-containing protein (DUF1111 family)